MKNAVLVFFSLFLLQGFSQSVDTFFSKTDAFFKANVKNGLVDYSGIKENPGELNSILDLAKSIRISKDDTKAFQAFWINGYNLHVIKGIIDNYPVKSPLDINGFFDKTKRDIGGIQITLNDIENKLLRENFSHEARFHFVLVCAGLGCPPIIDGAYSPSKLEAQLQKQTELALNNPNFIKVKGKKVLVSQIFEWYKVDFTQDGKDEIQFINQFRNEKLDTKAKLGYYPYDWTLNTVR
ncbi:DUF547 domain-containing protein [Croceivirga thetidis]|uniref:DUF547 domain-containing protein n=1 Tax=Croceivirga thetidis TaxID=2721623 RepID=A0ABX1GPW3_9FLAO|nr:DUF547 domain-containing protein [Croceivirga thetidis]NKI31664.1 DUF547 domain-containing protein [Croceivirga thetidis]